jgi:hypothetical protein
LVGSNRTECEGNVEQPLLGETAVLVVRIEEAADGRWHVCVEGAQTSIELPLVPAILVIQIWRANEAKTLRGTVQLHGSQHSAAIQSSTQLIELVQAWLCSNDDQELRIPSG